MKVKTPWLTPAFVVAVAIGTLVWAQMVRADSPVKPLKLGDPAPALQVADWVQGGPVKLANGKGKKAYIVEFWATWCPPCRMSIPHLNEIYKKYKDKGLEVVAITDEDAASVKSFVQSQGDKMTYPVVVDKDGLTAAAFMGGFNEDGIPHAFVVDTEGNIVWHGHPMDSLETVIQKYLPKQDTTKADGKDSKE